MSLRSNTGLYKTAWGFFFLVVNTETFFDPSVPISQLLIHFDGKKGHWKFQVCIFSFWDIHVQTKKNCCKWFDKSISKSIWNKMHTFHSNHYIEVQKWDHNIFRQNWGWLRWRPTVIWDQRTQRTLVAESSENSKWSQQHVPPVLIY